MTDTGIIFVMRIFWAVFMALMLIGGYRGSCNVENGKASPMRCLLYTSDAADD